MYISNKKNDIMAAWLAIHPYGFRLFMISKTLQKNGSR